MASFSDTLRTRSNSALISLLQARPDLAVPAPGSLASLAARATNRSSLERALAGLDQFHLQIIETIVALTPLPDAVTAPGIKTAIAGSTRKAVDAALTTLNTLALVWFDADVSTDVRTRPWHPAPGMADLIGPYPAGLGPLRPLGATGSAVVPVPDVALLTTGPTGASTILSALTWGPPVGRAPVSPSGAKVTDWLVTNGFLIRTDNSHVALPREVALTLRKGKTFPTAATHAPTPEAAEFPIEQINAQALGAVDATVHLVAELLAAWTIAPPAVLRSGGLGIRDLRKVAARLEVSEAETAFIVELAAGAGLITDDAALTPHLAPTPAAEEWLASDLASRWSRLVHAWAGSNRTPWLVGTRDARGALFAPLSPELVRPWVTRLRTSTLQVLADHPGLALDADAIASVLAWRTPRAIPPASAITELLGEAERLGVIGAGALSSMGAAVAAGTDPGSALAEALPSPVDEILLQGDLTGIIPGRPSPALYHLIDAAATIESRGGALTVRFTDRSITDALDGGMDAESLLTGLGAHSRTGIPQPLEYLIRDAGRRHGRLRVGSGASYIRVEDPALLTGLVEDSRLRALGLRTLAPTVLVAQVSAPELLDALREHGLAPVAEGLDGALIDVDARRRATIAPSVRAQAPTRGQSIERDTSVLVESDADRDSRISALVTKLRANAAAEAAGDKADEASASEGAQGVVVPPSASGTTDPADALTRLREAIDAKSEVWLEVIDGYGQPERRKVRPLRLEGGRLRALDLTREAELTVAVHRIARVATTDPS